VRRRGLTVALIGPDGAGKTTVARALPDRLDAPATYIYMGVNWDAGDHLLPTTRLVQAVRRARGGRDDAGGPPPPPGAEVPGSSSPRLGRRLAGATWSALALANRLAEESYRQLLVWVNVRRGVIVVFDRDFFSDYHAHDIAAGATRSPARRIHGYLLEHVYRKPDLVIFLDAPAAVLHARKGEGTLESLERRRQDYLALASVTPRFVSVDASNSLDDVIADVISEIDEAAAAPRPQPHS
jgi:thymidylate kinase